ncbi:MAG: hypothetical protein IAI48_13225 [Candidatus Eremiobacteraeota bacterium]|nr:hypothetical protein [Candidatus Eremiobacteraeota bacterium]
MRERVLARFDDAAAYRVILVTAPAGFGKSVAVRHYLERRKIDHVRCGLRRGDGSLLTFLGALAASLERVAPNMVHAYSNFYANVEESPTIVLGIAQWMAAMLKSFRGTIFVDDVHLAREDPRVGELLLELVERTEPDVRWIFAARDPQVLPVATWLAYGVCDVPIDEADLRLTNDEAAATARACDVSLAPPVLEHVLSLTDGWATAFAFALRAFERTSELGRVTHGTREMVYAFLAEQVFRSLDASDREFLMRTAPLPALDLRILAESHFHDPQATIERLRGTTSFIVEESDGVYRYHDLFRDFLDHELRRDNAAFADAYNDAATWLHRAKATGEALKLYREVQNQNAIVAILEAQGADLFDRGEVQSLENIIDELPNERVESSPLVLTLRAMIKAFRGQYGLADMLFSNALSDRDNSGLKAHVAMRYAITLARRWRMQDAAAVVRDINADTVEPISLRARFLAFKAYAMSTIHDSTASALARRAVNEIGWLQDSSLEATVLQYVALVAMNERKIEDARRFAEQAMAVAERDKLFGLAARLSMLLATIATENGDDDAALWHSMLMQRSAEQIGDRIAIESSMLIAHEIYVRRGDVSKIAAIEASLSDAWSTQNLGERWPVLQSSIAMQHGWAGEFLTAYQSIASSDGYAAQLPDAAWRNILRSSEIALYAAGASKPEIAKAQLRKFTEQISALPESAESSHFVLQAQIYAAITLLLLGQMSKANELIRSVELNINIANSSLIALAKTVRALYLQIETSGAYGGLGPALENLRSRNLAGLAKLIEALPLQTTSSTPTFSALTVTEVRVLLGIARGATSKELAKEMGRSALTIDSHVKSIVRKLGCDGRRAAVAFARLKGFV